MVAEFQVIDYIKQEYPARDGMPAAVYHRLICLDVGECPMRQLPQYQLQDSEVEKFANVGSAGKRLKLEVREMSGRGNPLMKGRIIGVVGNGAQGK